MKEWQLADNSFRLRMHRAKPASEMKRSGIELHCELVRRRGIELHYELVRRRKMKKWQFEENYESNLK